MARISTYEQDSTLNTQDKVLGTDSATGGTKNYTINSLVGLINDENLVSAFDGVIYTFQSYIDPANEVKGVLNLNASSASTTTFSTVGTIYLSVLDFKGNSVEEYLEYVGSDNPKFLKISKFGDVNTFGIFEITAMADYGSNKYKKLTVIARGSNGNLTPNDRYFVANYSAQYDQNFDDDSITEFGDVSNGFFTGTGITELTNAGSGAIITSAERTKLSTAIIATDVVNNLTDTATDAPLSANQGKVLKDLIDSINTLLTSDNIDLDTLQEVVDYIETNRTNLESLGISNITGLQTALDAKQNTESGKGLSQEDFTTILKNKLDGIASEAEVNVNANWTAVSGDAFIENKPTGLLTSTSTDSSISLSVTALSDVTSAGSGAIITGAERTKVSNTPSFSGTAGKIAYFSDANSVASDNNLHWDATNDRLGIGTDSPSSPLDVKSNSTSSANSGITLTANGSTDAVFRIGEKSTNGGRFHMYDAGIEKIAFYTDGTNNHISAGNLGIGTTSAGGKLHIYEGASGQSTPNASASSLILEDNADNGLSILTPNTGIGSIFFGDNDDNFVGGFRYDHSDNSLDVNVNNALAVAIDSSRNVGIGIDSPAQKLHVAGNIRVNSSTHSVYANRFTALSNADVQIRSNDGYDLILNSSAGDNVGIGTDSPTQKLHVSGNARVTGAIYDSTNSAGGSGQVLMSTGSGTNWSNIASMSTLRLRSAAAQSANAATDIAVQWDTQEISPDSNFAHSTSTNNSRIQVVNSGKYLVTGYVNYTGTTSNYRFTTRLSIRVNGTDILNDFFDGTYVRGSAGIADHGGSFSLVVDLSANDYIEVLSKKTSTNSGNATIADGTNISLVRLAGVKGEKGDTGGVSIANFGDNRLVTSGATESAINGESNLTFDGSTLALTGAQTVSGDLTVSSDLTVSGNLIGATATSGFSVTGDLAVDTDTLFVDSTNNNIGIGTTSPGAKLQINGGTNPYVLNAPNAGGLSTYGIDVTAAAGGADNYGGAISFGTKASNSGGRAAIAGLQTSGDNDDVALAFFIHDSTSASDAANLIMRLGDQHNRDLTLFTSNTDTQGIFFADTDHDRRTGINYNHSTNQMKIAGGNYGGFDNNTFITADSTDGVKIGYSDTLRVEGNNTYLKYIKSNIGTINPLAEFTSTRFNAEYEIRLQQLTTQASSVVDGQELGLFSFYGQTKDASDVLTRDEFARIQVNAVSVDPTDAKGSINFYVKRGGNSNVLHALQLIAGTSSGQTRLNVLQGTLNIANIPTSASGLSSGDIYSDGGTLKVVA